MGVSADILRGHNITGYCEIKVSSHAPYSFSVAIPIRICLLPFSPLFVLYGCHFDLSFFVHFICYFFQLLVQNDCVNSGAKFLEQERCVTDGRLVTAQVPDDLPAFMSAILKVAGECGCH